jgi:hypothetical protein
MLAVNAAPNGPGGYGPWIAEMLARLPPAARVLDAGCGCGASTRHDWLGGTAEMKWTCADAGTSRRWLSEAGLTVTEQEFIPEGNGGHALFWARMDA